jgi:rhodanese-related sulfurtransferase
MPFRDLEPAQALTELRSEASLRVLDVRTQPEFDLHHIQDAMLVPIEELQVRVQELDPATSWLVTCEHGMRSMAACEFLTSLGFQDVRNVNGGMARWLGEGLPLDPSQE